MTTKNKNELDMNKLTKALDNVNNDNIMNLTTRKLMELNLKILKELMFDKETLIFHLKHLFLDGLCIFQNNLKRHEDYCYL